MNFWARNISLGLLLFLCGNTFSQKGKYALPLKFEIPQKMPAHVNSMDHHYSMRFSPNGKRIIYSTRVKVVDHGHHKVVHQDIWEVEKDASGNWTAPIKDASVYNLELENQLVGISEDENHIYLQSHSEKGYYTGINMRRFVDGKWKAPEKMPVPELKHPPHHLQVYLNESEDVLIFSMHLKHDKGKQDLYVCEKNPYGAWGKIKNLGFQINTSGNEYSPWLSPDKKTLFFSSDGHFGAGGSDIFKTTRLGSGWDHWSIPENLGSQINSPGNDVGFCINSDNEVIFIRNADTDSSKIYTSVLLPTPYTRHLFPELRKNRLVFSSVNSPKISGKIRDGQGNFIAGAKVDLINLRTNDGYTIEPNSKGEFTYNLEPNEEYKIKINCVGYFGDESMISTKGNNRSESFSHTYYLEPNGQSTAYVIDDSAARLAKLEAEKKAEAERLAKLESERKAKEETERLAESKKEEAARLESERLAKLEAEKKAEAERLAKLESERKAKEETERLAELKKEEAARLESERLAKLEAEKKAEAERLAKLESERKAKEEAARLAELKKEEAAARLESERLAKLEAEKKAEAERLAKLESERKAKEEAARLAELKKEEAARLEVERLAKLEVEKKAEADRLAKLESEKQAEKAKQDKYDMFLKFGRSALEQDNLGKAKSDFETAVNILPERDEAKKELRKVEGLIVKKEEDQAIHTKYEGAMAEGEKFLSEQKYDQANESFNQALSFKPEDPEALAMLNEVVTEKRKLSEIDRLSDLQSPKTDRQIDAIIAQQEAAEKEKENYEQAYKDVLHEGNDALLQREFHLAKTKYQAALQYKPDNQKIKDKIIEIDELIAKEEAFEDRSGSFTITEKRHEGSTTADSIIIVSKGTELIVGEINTFPQIKGIVQDGTSGEPLKAALVYITNKKTQETQKLMSLANGKFNFSLPSESTFELKVIRRGYLTYLKDFNTFGKRGGDIVSLQVLLQTK